MAWFEYSIERIKETNSCICRELVFELGIKDMRQSLIAIIVVLGTLCIMNAMQNNFSMNHFTTYLAILYMIFFIAIMIKNTIFENRNIYKNRNSLKHLSKIREGGNAVDKSYIINVVEEIIEKENLKQEENGEFSYVEVYDFLIKEVEEYSNEYKISLKAFCQEYVFVVDENAKDVKLQRKDIYLKLRASKQSSKKLEWEICK